MRASDDALKKFYQWLWPHRETVLRTARFLMRDPFEADDLAQDTMLKAFRAIDRFRPGSDAKAWLLSILRNARIDRLRALASRRNEVSLDDAGIDPPDDQQSPGMPASGSQSPADLLERFSDADIIAALQELPEEIRWTLVLIDVEGMDQNDAAGILGVPLGTVKSRAHRGRGMLRETLAVKARELRFIR